MHHISVVRLPHSKSTSLNPPNPPSTRAGRTAYIEAFGASRCVFESNFSVDKVSYSYQVFWNTCERLVSGASPSEKTTPFCGTTRHLYHLGTVSLG